MISQYTIYIKGDKPLLTKDKEYQENHLYMDKTRMNFGTRVYLYIDNGIKKKRKRIDLDMKYMYNIGIAMVDNRIMLYLHKYNYNFENTITYQFIEEIVEEIKI